MQTIRQIGVVTLLNIKSLPSRVWSSLVIVVGMACVIGVLLSMLSLAAGISSALLGAGDPGRIIVTSLDTPGEGASALAKNLVSIIKDAPGIKKDADGTALADAEMISNIPIKKKGSGLNGNILVRGFGPKGMALRPELKIVAGRMPHSGAREMIVGIGAQAQFIGLDLGKTIAWDGAKWPIVGVFSTGGDSLEGNLITDVELAMVAARRPAYTSVVARLDPATGSFDAVKKSLTTNPQLSVQVERHTDYFIRQSQQFSPLMNGVSYSVGGLLAVGALFGALNVMYSAVAARRQEIATLRALGFGAFPVAVSVIAESLLLALIGALIGAGIAWFLYNGALTTFGNNVFHMAVSPTLIIIGVAWALSIAFVGGFFPSLRAARLPIATALRAV